MHDRLSPDPAGERTAIRSIPSASRLRPSPLGFGFLLFGVLLPICTLAFELLTHACAQEFFDPIPSWFHVALVALVPICNGLIWHKLRSPGWSPGRWLPFAAAISIGVSTAYMVLFLPMLPFAVIGIMFAGLGFLPLAPLLALHYGTRAWRSMKERLPAIRLAPGLFMAVILLGLPLSRSYVTQRLLDRATEGSVEDQVNAIQWLRLVGDRDVLLKRSYGVRPQIPFFVQRNVEKRDPEAVQGVYYRVTGQAYESAPLPAGVSWTRRRGSFSFDPDLGGRRVGNKVYGLTASASNLEARVDPIGLTSYTEWTLVFKNAAQSVSEARAEIELPPEGVVSRVTLWIDGEPREAAFGGREQVRSAYQEVAVVQRRDPILVTTSGLDRVLMQCFPVPASGGTMKVRLGITAPLRMIEGAVAGASLPRFIDTNFETSWSFNHELVMRGDVHFEKGAKEIRAEFAADELATAREIRMKLLGSIQDVVAEDPTQPDSVIRQTHREELLPRPKRIVYVIDGSREMADFQGGLRQIFEAAGEKPDAAFLAGDTVKRWDKAIPFSAWMAEQDFAGGCDNVPALRAAWSEAAQGPGAVIVWIHGSQPVEIQSVETLLQRAEVDTHKPLIYDIPGSAAPNLISAKLAHAVNWKRPPSLSSPLKNLMDVQSDLTGTRKVLRTERRRLPVAESGNALPKADKHVTRLWGREEVERLKAGGDTKAAMDLAVKLQLVTPVTGAVVLERKEQYDRHNLKPAETSTVPMIPEPGSILLLASGVSLLAARRRRASV